MSWKDRVNWIVKNETALEKVNDIGTVAFVLGMVNNPVFLDYDLFILNKNLHQISSPLNGNVIDHGINRRERSLKIYLSPLESYLRRFHFLTEDLDWNDAKIYRYGSNFWKYL